MHILFAYKKINCVTCHISPTMSDAFHVWLQIFVFVREAMTQQTVELRPHILNVEHVLHTYVLSMNQTLHSDLSLYHETISHVETLRYPWQFTVYIRLWPLTELISSVKEKLACNTLCIQFRHQNRKYISILVLSVLIQTYFQTHSEHAWNSPRNWYSGLPNIRDMNEECAMTLFAYRDPRDLSSSPNVFNAIQNTENTESIQSTCIHT